MLMMDTKIRNEDAGGHQPIHNQIEARSHNNMGVCVMVVVTPNIGGISCVISV